MPPALATFLTLVGVLLLLRHEVKSAESQSPALWLPVLWLSITGSRFVSQWMELGAAPSDSYGDGSTIDALFFAFLIMSALFVMARRSVSVGSVVQANFWLMALVFYGLLSVAWSDFPVVAAKRWVKALGHPLMALVILTDPNPQAALRTVVRRCAYLLMPASVLFIKYLPEYGRGFDSWTGEAYNNGVGLNKNSLGYICLVFAIFYVWSFATLKRTADMRKRRVDALLSGAFLWMAVWLIHMSDSATSLSTFLLGAAVILLLGTRIVTKRHFGALVALVLATAFALESAFDIYATVVGLLGRDPTLTDRTIIWGDVLGLQNRPVLGLGFESFWLGSRLDVLWAKWPWRPNQAHNGYIETYLNLGLIGVFLLALLLFSTFRRISRQLQTDLDFARLRMALLFAIVLFNYTEAAFKGVHFIWTIFFIIAMDPPREVQSAHAGGHTSVVKEK